MVTLEEEEQAVVEEGRVETIREVVVVVEAVAALVEVGVGGEWVQSMM